MRTLSHLRMEAVALKSFSLQEKGSCTIEANSVYSVIISSVILPLFYKSITTGEGIAPNLADSYWGYATSAATLAIALFAPILGTTVIIRNGKCGCSQVSS